MKIWEFAWKHRDEKGWFFCVFEKCEREREEERGVDLVFPCLRNARERGLEFAFSVLEK